MNRAVSVSLVAMAHCLEGASAWGLDGPTPRRAILRDGMLLPLIGAANPAGATEAEAAPRTPPSSAPPGSDEFSGGVLWRTARGDALPATPASLAGIIQDELLGPPSPSGGRASSSGIVCISERHDDAEHHKVQLKVLMSMRKALKQRSQDEGRQVPIPLSVGMEMFQRRHQIHLDEYIARPEAYSIADLMRDTDWDSTWGYDMLHYLPILMYAQRSGMRVLGLHPSEEEVARVALHGLGDGASPPIPAGVLRTTDRAHMEDFRRVAAAQASPSDLGGCAAGAEAALARRYEVQCFREEYMAESVAAHVAASGGAEGGDGWIAILAGERHVLRRNGLPFRALRRTADVRKRFPSSPSRGLFTFVPRTAAFPASAEDAPGMELADYFWYVPRDPATEFKENEVNSAPMRRSHRQDRA